MRPITVRNSGGKLDASSSVILNKTSQDGPINFLAQATQGAGKELQESFNEAIYHDLTNVFREKQKKRKKKKPRSSPRRLTRLCNKPKVLKINGRGEGREGRDKLDRCHRSIELYRFYIDCSLCCIVMYRFIVNCKSSAILYIRVSRCPSLFHRSLYIYMYIQNFPSRQTDRFSLFVANTHIHIEM